MGQFDFLAQHYNAMTGFPGRIAKLEAAIRPWVDRWHVSEALDSGCGGGALLLALGRCGVTAVGLDNSESMLGLAAANTKKQGREFELRLAGHDDAGALFPRRFDAVFCIGNSLISAGNNQEMIRWLSGMRQSLKPGGHLLIQILNLVPFFDGAKTLINRRTAGAYEYVRVARPMGDHLAFCALNLGAGDDVNASISLWERWDAPRLGLCLTEAGFADHEVFGGLDGSEFAADNSADLVIAAHCPA